MFRSELLRWLSRVELSRTQVFQNTQLMGLRFHALVTEGGDQGVQLHSF